MRKDLSMSKGKMVAQGSHASLACITNRVKAANEMNLRLTDEELEWFNDSFTKICLGIKSEEELLEIYNKLKDLGINVVLITDNKLSLRDENPVHTCIGIGPCDELKVKDIIGHLKVFGRKIRSITRNFKGSNNTWFTNYFIQEQKLNLQVKSILFRRFYSPWGLHILTVPYNLKIVNIYRPIGIDIPHQVFSTRVITVKPVFYKDMNIRITHNSITIQIVPTETTIGTSLAYVPSQTVPLSHTSFF